MQGKREAGKGMDDGERPGSAQQQYTLASLVRSLTDHDGCSDEGYLHVQNDDHQCLANELHRGISCGLADSVRDMCWWLDQGICHEHAKSHGADIGGVNNTDIPLPSGRK